MIILLSMSLGVSFRPGGLGLVGERFVGGWGGLGEKIGQGFPCLGVIFPVEVSLGGSFGPCVLGFIGKVVFGSWEDLRSKFRKGFPCLEVFFVRESMSEAFFGVGGSCKHYWNL